MKKSILTITLSATFLFSSGVILSSCGGTENKEETHEHMEGDDHSEMNQEMADATYACPMHPEITGAEGDKCSICKMDLKATDNDMKSH
ncbi:heavy metal-binding domain-containing protein [uncultured Arcticibacterium sp.]|uniref:heavy metal-binding domain-containing protein n=1 Tax=uncultured Arcticibacterium sp. TaxID=2173042 RepID=UPI0030F6E22C